MRYRSRKLYFFFNSKKYLIEEETQIMFVKSHIKNASIKNIQRRTPPAYAVLVLQELELLRSAEAAVQAQPVSLLLEPVYATCNLWEGTKK
jgi:hypothetical protein